MTAPDSTPDAATAGGLAVRAWTWFVALGGAAVLGLAALDLLEGGADSGVAWLVLAGAVLAVGPILFGRLGRIAVGPTGFELRFDLSQEIAGLGADDTARRIDRWGGGLAEAAHAYASAHTVLQDDDLRRARQRIQDHFVDAAAASALVQQYDAAEVRRLFRDGPPVVRVLVLGLMLGDPSLADTATIESAITESRTANEQFQGLRLAEALGRRLPPEDRRRLRQAIEREPIPHGHDRIRVRASVLGLLGGSADDADDNGVDDAAGGTGAGRPAPSSETAAPSTPGRGGSRPGQPGSRPLAS